MNNSPPTHDDPERRHESNADLRAQLDDINQKVSDSPKLTEDDMSQLFELTRDYYRHGIGQRSPDLLRLVREEHSDELSPVMLALLDDVLGRRAKNE